jgi:hypothetical protein
MTKQRRSIKRALARLPRRGALALAAAGTLLGAAGASQAAASATHLAWHSGHKVVCQHDIRIPVALAPGKPAGQTVSGELCSAEAERHKGTTVQLLIPGATYTHHYWDFGKVDGIRYSYARSVAAGGFATFAIDTLGTGDSSHPVSTALTAQASAFVAHQLVQALRHGRVDGIRFGKVIEVGHSLNSLIVWDEAIAYHDVAGVIVTGAAHSLAAAFAKSNAFYPAKDDPKFAGSGLDSGYLTTVPGSRAKLFYHAPDADPRVIKVDEQRKDIVSATELNTALGVLATKATRAITVPVLDLLGSHDFTTCGLSTTGTTFDCSSGAAVAAQEAPFYSPQAQLHACIVPGSGHDISLARNHRRQVADVLAWSRHFVGQHSPAGSTSQRSSDRLPAGCA